MKEDMNEFEEFSLKKLISVLWKNKILITCFLLVGLLVGLFVSEIQDIQNPGSYRYQAKSTLEIIESQEMKGQPPILLFALESNTLLENSSIKLNIKEGEYEVLTQKSAKPNQYDIIVEGPDKDLAVDLVNEIVSQGLSLLPPLLMENNRIIEYGNIFGDSILVSEPVNKLLYIIVFMILGVMISIMLIFGVRSLDGKVHTKDDVEAILKTSVITSLPYDGKDNKFKSLFKVR